MLKQKQKNAKRKLFNFYNLINTFNYTDCKKINYKGFSGVAYCIERFSNYERIDTQKEFESNIKNIIDNFDNVEILKTFCEYAPEIKKTWLFISK